MRHNLFPTAAVPYHITTSTRNIKKVPNSNKDNKFQGFPSHQWIPTQVPKFRTNNSDRRQIPNLGIYLSITLVADSPRSFMRALTFFQAFHK